MKESPGDPNFRLSLAGLQILKGNPNAAIEQYENLLKDQPNLLVAINNLVSLLLDYRSDKESLERAASLAEGLKASNVPQFRDTLGWVQFQQKDYKTSIATLESVAAVRPKLAAVHYHLGMSYAANGDTEKAITELKTALSLDSEGSIANLEDGAAKLPNLAAVHYHLGISYAAIGDFKKATDEFKTALSLEPEGTALKESIRAALK